MPHFEDLRDLAKQVAEWADLRHEQGMPAAPEVARARRELKRAQRALQTLAPGRAQVAKEPNNLDAIRALRPRGPRALAGTASPAAFRRRLKGAWLGRAAGCTLGAPVEAWSVADMEALAAECGMAFPPTGYWKDHPNLKQKRYADETFLDFLEGHIRFVPADDDLAYTLLGLLILEEYGPGFTTEDVGAAWLKYLPVACTAERVALENLKEGVPAGKAGEKDNPYQEWIGADIRSDPWGYAAPGRPEQAAAMAYRDAYLSHRQNGIYGAMFFSAAIAAAFVVDDPMEALRTGLTEIPKECRLARDVRWALRIAPGLKDWRAGRAQVDRRFKGMHTVHTNNNACLTVFGLHLGAMDFTKTIGTTVAMGLDNDCTAATAGSILGAIIGIDGIPAHWWKPFRNRVRTYLTGRETFVTTDIVKRFEKVAQAAKNDGVG